MFKMLPIKAGVGDSVQKHFLLYLYTISWHPDSNLLVYWHTAGAVADCLWQEWQRNNSHTSNHQWNLQQLTLLNTERKERLNSRRLPKKISWTVQGVKGDIGVALKWWRQLKESKGLNTDARLAGNELVSFGWKYCAFCSQHSWYWLCYSRMFLPKTNISSL